MEKWREGKGRGKWVFAMLPHKAHGKCTPLPCPLQMHTAKTHFSVYFTGAHDKDLARKIGGE
jgi:hypothetical protein